MKFSENDCVKATRDFPEYSVKAGDLGTVVFVFTLPHEAYEVEFFDNKETPRTSFAVLPNDVEKVVF